MLVLLCVPCHAHISKCHSPEALRDFQKHRLVESFIAEMGITTFLHRLLVQTRRLHSDLSRGLSPALPASPPLAEACSATVHTPVDHSLVSEAVWVWRSTCPGSRELVLTHPAPGARLAGRQLQAVNDNRAACASQVRGPR